MGEQKKDICKYCNKGWISVKVFLKDGKISAIDYENTDKSYEFGIPCKCPAGERLVSNFKIKNNLPLREEAFKIARGVFQERCAAFYSNPEESREMRKNVFAEIKAKFGKKYEKIKTVNSLMEVPSR